MEARKARLADAAARVAFASDAHAHAARQRDELIVSLRADRIGVTELSRLAGLSRETVYGVLRRDGKG